MKNILITGGAGFVGYHLAKRLASQGRNVYIVDNFFRGQDDQELSALRALPNVWFLERDLTKWESWEDIGGGFSEVYHLAGINGTKLFYDMPQEVLRIGVVSLIYALEWFRTKNNTPGAKILFTSSNEAYADALAAFNQLPLPTPESVPLVIADPYNPRSSYAAQKLVGELFFIHYAKAYSFRMSIVRPHNFYGPRAGYGHVIPEIIERILKRVEPFTIFSPEDTRSFCYIDDAVEAMERVMESTVTDGGTYHIGTTEETRVGDLSEHIFKQLGWRPKNLDVKEALQGSVKRRLADVSKIKRDTGWEAKTSLEEGLTKTVAWYIKNPRT